jgi:hypothetical protein
MSTELADPDLYERDFFLWTQRQAAELRRAAAARVNLPLDFLNLAEEVESLGKTDRRAVVSHLATILEHLLKLELSPSDRPRAGWMRSVRDARKDLLLILEDNPVLAAKLPELIARAYRFGADEARYGLQKYGEKAQVPAECSYSVEQIQDLGWWPEQRARR